MITRQLASQEVIYSNDKLDYRVRLKRYDDIEEVNKWDEWFIERDHEIDPIPDTLTEEDLKFMLACIKKANKEMKELE